MRIYVACLAAYNSGFLHGKWIDCEGKDADTIREETKEMLKQSPEPDAEEWAIHDYEGFGSYRVEEGTSFDTIGTLAQAVQNSGHELDLITGVMQDRGLDVEEAIEYIDDNYCGEHEDFKAYAWDWLESSGELDSIPKHLQYYFDIEAYARDMDLNGGFITVDADNGNIHVLFNN